MLDLQHPGPPGACPGAGAGGSGLGHDADAGGAQEELWDAGQGRRGPARQPQREPAVRELQQLQLGGLCTCSTGLNI